MKAHERQQLDLKGCEAGETTVPIDPIQDPQNYHKWGDCIQNETLSGIDSTTTNFLSWIRNFGLAVQF